MFNRIARLFRSIVNALLGRAEAALTVEQMQQAYREMQQNLFRYKQAVAGAIAYEKRALRKLEEEESRLTGLTDKARVAAEQSMKEPDQTKKEELERLAKRALQLRRQVEQTVATLRTAYDQAKGQAEASRKRFNMAADEVEKRARQLEQAKTITELNKARKEVVQMAGSLQIDNATGVFDEGLERVLGDADKIDAMDQLALSEGQELDQKLAELAGGASVDQDFAALVSEISGVPAQPARPVKAAEAVEIDTALG